MAIEFEVSPLSPRQRLGLLAASVVVGVISLLTIKYQDLSWKILRLSLVGSGAIAGAVLLHEYRPKAEEEVNSYESSQLAMVEDERLRLIQENELLDQRLQQWADEQTQQWQQQYNDQAQMYEQIINQQYQKIAQLEGIKRPKGNSRIEWVADQIIDVLLEYEIYCDYKDSHAVPGCDLIWVIPRTGVRVRKLKDIAEEIQLRIPGIEVPPEITVSDGAIQISCSADKAKVDRKAVEKGNKLIEPSGDWFRAMTTHPDVNHLFCNGDTGSGKSTLIDNFICLAKQELGNNVEIIIIDPKFPDSTWVIDGEEILPQYKGYEPLTDEYGEEHPSALDGLRAMYDDVRSRLENAAQAKLAGREKPNRIPRIYVIDEAEDLIATFGDDAAEPIRSVLRVGRSTKVKAVIIGQNPGCKAYKMEKANLRNCGQLYLRENALAGIDQVAPTAALKKQLRDQISLRQVEGEKDRSKRFYTLIKYPGMPAFTALCPPPAAYSGDSTEDVIGSIEDLVEAAKHGELHN
ncbi:MAG: type IV secretory system conjugative DNA transfer family protein [Crinalium sp.]